MPKQMRRLALRSALSDKMEAGDVMVVDQLGVEDGRTKTLLLAMEALGLTGNILIILPERDDAMRRAAGNLAKVFVADPSSFDLLQVIQANKVVFVGEAAQRLSEILAKAPRPRPSGQRPG